MSSRILPKFELLMPKSLAEAVELLGAYGEKAAVMAGGTDLLVLMKDGVQSEYVLSLSAIKELAYLEFDAAAGLRIGAMTTMADVVASDVVKKKYPALWTSAQINGTAQTRNAATVVGNILRASPAGDCCCAALAIGGSVVLQGPGGQREVDLEQFWLDYRKTARKSDELAVELKLPAPAPGAVSAFAAMTRTASDISKINAAASLLMEGGVCQKARLTMGAVAPTTLRLKKCEELLAGKSISDELLGQVASLAAQEISPISDVRSTAAYRSQVSGPLLKQVIMDASAAA